MATIILLILFFYLKQDNYPSEIGKPQENRKGGSEAVNSSQACVVIQEVASYLQCDQL